MTTAVFVYNYSQYLWFVLHCYCQLYRNADLFSAKQFFAIICGLRISNGNFEVCWIEYSFASINCQKSALWTLCSAFSVSPCKVLLSVLLAQRTFLLHWCIMLKFSIDIHMNRFCSCTVTCNACQKCWRDMMMLVLQRFQNNFRYYSSSMIETEAV